MLIFRYNRISGYKWVGWLFPVGYNRISGYKCVGRLFPVACVQVRRLRVAGWLWRPEFSCRLSEPESSCRLIEPAWCVCVCRCLRWACCTPRPSWWATTSTSFRTCSTPRCWRHAWRSRTPRRWGQDRGEGGARGLRLTPNPIIVFAWGAMTPWFLLTHTHIFIRAGCWLLGWQAGRQAGKPSAGRQAGVGEGAGGALNPNSLKPAKAEGAASGWPNRAATLTLS